MFELSRLFVLSGIFSRKAPDCCDDSPFKQLLFGELPEFDPCDEGEDGMIGCRSWCQEWGLFEQIVTPTLMLI